MNMHKVKPSKYWISEENSEENKSEVYQKFDLLTTPKCFALLSIKRLEFDFNVIPGMSFLNVFVRRNMPSIKCRKFETYTACVN